MSREYVSWTYEQDKIILGESLTIEDKIKITNRTEGAINKRFRTLTKKYKLDVEKLNEEQDMIIELYPDISIVNIAQYLDNKSFHYIKERLKELEGRQLIRENKTIKSNDKEYIANLIDNNGLIKTANENNVSIRLLEVMNEMNLLETREYTTMNSKEIKRATKQALEEEKKARDYGIGKKKLDIEFEKDKNYILKIMENRGKTRTIKGKLVQATHNHITFESNNKVRESFLRNDFLMNEIQIKEVLK